MKTNLNRREFLQTSGSVLAVVALDPAGVAADNPSHKRRIKKAIMYATVGVKGSVLEKFRAIKEAGFEGVEPMSHMNQDEVMKASRPPDSKPPAPVAARIGTSRCRTRTRRCARRDWKG